MSYSKACLAVLLAACFGAAQAAPKTLVLPAETAKLRDSALPGHAIALQKCAICHSADYINYQPPGMSLSQWTAEVGKMQHTYGAPLDDKEVKLIGAYLAVAYGGVAEQTLPAELRQAPANAAAAAATAPAAAQSVDVQGLLSANACLSCHAIDHKVVGPAYREVASRYRADPQAAAKLAASIHGGSSGKWGATAMPPFLQLKPEELQALAAFVLKQ